MVYARQPPLVVMQRVPIHGLEPRFRNCMRTALTRYVSRDQRQPVQRRRPDRNGPAEEEPVRDPPKSASPAAAMPNAPNTDVSGLNVCGKTCSRSPAFDLRRIEALLNGPGPAGEPAFHDPESCRNGAFAWRMLGPRTGYGRRCERDPTPETRLRRKRPVPERSNEERSRRSRQVRAVGKTRSLESA